MRRRSLLVALGGAAFTTGCARSGSDGESTTGSVGEPGDSAGAGTPAGDGGSRTATGAPTEGRDAECPREIIPYDRFPAELQAEIDAALDGRYEAAEVRLRDAMDVTDSYVAVDDAYYDPAVATEGGTEVLTLQQVEPKALPSGRSITVEHRLDGERVITVEVVAGDGTVLVDATMDLWPGGAVEFGRVARVGTHEFRVTVVDGDEVKTRATEPVRVVPSLASVHVAVGPEEVQTREAVADAPRCRFAS